MRVTLLGFFLAFDQIIPKNGAGMFSSTRRCSWFFHDFMRVWKPQTFILWKEASHVLQPWILIDCISPSFKQAWLVQKDSTQEPLSWESVIYVVRTCLQETQPYREKQKLIVFVSWGKKQNHLNFIKFWDSSVTQRLLSEGVKGGIGSTQSVPTDKRLDG